MSKQSFQVDPSDILWTGKVPFRNSEYRIIRLDPETCFVQENLGDSWTSDVSDGVCAEVYMTAFLQGRN